MLDMMSGSSQATGKTRINYSKVNGNTEILQQSNLVQDPYIKF